VTGAARGIGAAIAHALAADGWTVAVCDLDEAAATATAATLTADHGLPAAGIAVDIASTDSVRAAVAQIESEVGPIFALVNNAGIDVIKPFIDSTEDEWDRIIAVNLKGTIACCRAVLDGMAERNEGRIVTIASDAGRVGSSGEAVYSATKGGVTIRTVDDGVHFTPAGGVLMAPYLMPQIVASGRAEAAKSGV